MQPPGRDERGGNNARPLGGGAFPPFPDPFAGFGTRPAFLNDMFENDPFFSDPFFTRPFGSLFGGSGGLFGPSGFFNQGMFPPGMGQQGNIFQQGHSIDRRPFNAPMDGGRRNIFIEGEEGGRRGVHIEELPDDHDDIGDVRPSSNQEPIIEHPDDEVKTTELARYQTDRPSCRTRGQRSTNNTVHAYSFQSASVMYGGPNGPYYSAHSSRRVGPNGVYEEQHQEKDTTSGKETQRIVHGLGDKGRAMTRKRNADGREENLENLQNLTEGEVPDFERTWESCAENSFPRYKSSSQRLGSNSKPRAALPSSSHSRSKGR